MKLRGFTIIELTIAMLITTIVLGIAGTALIMTQKQLHNFDRRSQEAYKESQLAYLIRKDFDLSDSIKYVNDTMYCYRTGGAISYKVEEQYVLRREALQADTFHAALHLKQVTEQYGYVRKADYEIIINERPYFIVLEKEYAPAMIVHKIY